MSNTETIYCQLTGRDGNAASVMARVSEALRRAKVDKEEITQYRIDCMRGDYDHLLQVSMKILEDKGIEYN